MSRILIVEDEKRLVRSIRDGLNEQGYETLFSINGEAALSLIRSQRVDLLILDLMLPGMSGLDVLKAIRTNGYQFPVLVLTASDQIGRRVQLLDAGADDYVAKPFSYPELLARVRALLRRGPPMESFGFSLGDLSIDLLQRKVSRNSLPVDLSRREFEILEYFLRHRNQTVSREMLARDVWHDALTLETNVIDVFIRRLRRKIDVIDGESYIQTIRGAGYRLQEPQKS